MAAENTVKLLWNCANTLNTETHTSKLLKSYYMSTSRKIAKHNIQMPKEKFSATQMCQHCSIFWEENEFHLKLQPQMVANNAKARNLIAKLEKSKATKQKGLLTKKQKQRAKWLKKRVTSNMEIHCEFCGHKTIVPLEKPKRTEKPQIDREEVQQIEISDSTKSKKKKNKSKNKTAGLKISPANVVETKKKRRENIESKPIKTTTTSVKNTTAKSAKSVMPTIANASLNQTLKAKNKKGKGAVQSAAPKILSKTKQKNSLLQLASLLKTQAAKSSTNTMQDRLKSLLK